MFCLFGITSMFSMLYWVKVATPHLLGVVFLTESYDSTVVVGNQDSS